jgi:hypothetical protein
MNTCSVVRSSRPAGLVSFGLLDGLHGWRYQEPAGAQARRDLFIAPCALREAPAGFGFEAAFMNSPGNRSRGYFARKRMTPIIAAIR